MYLYEYKSKLKLAHFKQTSFRARTITATEIAGTF